MVTVMIWKILYLMGLILLKDPHSKGGMIDEFCWGYSEIGKKNYANDDIS